MAHESLAELTTDSITPPDGPFYWGCSVGRFAHRRLLCAIALLQSQGVNIRVEVISKGLLDLDYMLTVTGTAEDCEIVDHVLGQASGRRRNT